MRPSHHIAKLEGKTIVRPANNYSKIGGYRQASRHDGLKPIADIFRPAGTLFHPVPRRLKIFFFAILICHPYGVSSGSLFFTENKTHSY